MSTAQPAITVLMPAHNTAAFIGEAIASVLAQTFADFELLIINDGSTDETAAVVERFNDARIVLVHQPQQGIAAALNRGLQLARAPLVARFDADDICTPGRLQAQYDFIRANPGCVVVGCDVDYVDAHGGHVFTHAMQAHTDAAIRGLPPHICPFIHSGVLFVKAAIIRAGGYNERAHTFEDHLLWNQVLQQGLGCNLPQVLLKVRLNPPSLTIDEKWRPARFLAIKKAVLQKGTITEAEGAELAALLQQQQNNRLKEGAYHALLAKKFLWNNHQPNKARFHLRLAMRAKPFSATLRGLYLLSYLPGNWVRWLYRQLGSKHYEPATGQKTKTGNSVRP
jgi:glycosyltransferase involved in cell wall biosynthesis